MSDAPKNLLRKMITDSLPDFVYDDKTKNIDNLVNLEKEVYKTPYSDETTTTFDKKYNDLLQRFNTYVITDANPFLERLTKLKNIMDQVIQYKEQFLSQYEKVKIMPSTTPDTTFLENGIEKEYNNDIYYEFVMNNNINMKEKSKIISVTSRTIRLHDDFAQTQTNVKFDNYVREYPTSTVELYKKRDIIDIDITGGRRKPKSRRRKISGKRRRRKTSNKKRLGKK